MTIEEVLKALECCNDGACEYCPFTDNDCIQKSRKEAIDLINRQKAEIGELISKLERLLCHATNGKLSYHTYSIATMEAHVTDAFNKSYDDGYKDAIKEYAEKITEVFLRYAHLHTYAEKSRTETIESAEGEKIEMQSVWDVLSLKKYEMAEYEEMSELQINIEIIAKEQLLTELEKDFRLLKKEMVGDSDA